MIAFTLNLTNNVLESIQHYFAIFCITIQSHRYLFTQIYFNIWLRRLLDSMIAAIVINMRPQCTLGWRTFILELASIYIEISICRATCDPHHCRMGQYIRIYIVSFVYRIPGKSYGRFCTILSDAGCKSVWRC